ncbi:hypothetical protein [Burkholderia cepacia]|uniref:hypothetical protein n=1 Tax=Burkholderia cepacia TaxID=292 RepID=UPI000A3DB914|nr:hypothetical protein [Burkholderia cepacia]
MIARTGNRYLVGRWLVVFVVLALAACGGDINSQGTDSGSGGSQPSPPALLTLGSGGKMLAADGNSLLYVAADGSARMRNFGSQTEVVLNGFASLQNAGNWQLSGGYAYVSAVDSDCPQPLPFHCIYQWDPKGVKTNMSVLAGTAGQSDDLAPSAHDGYLLWNSYGGGALYNQSTKTFTRLPPGESAAVNSFTVSNGIVTYYYWHQLPEAFFPQQVYMWSSQTQASTALWQMYPGGSVQTDGQSVAWLGGISAQGGTHIQNLFWQAATGGPVSISPDEVGGGAYFLLSEGVLAWVETQQTFSRLDLRAVVVSTGKINTLSTDMTARLLGNAAGNVIYQESAANKVYRWQASTGAVTQLLDSVPNQLIQSGTYVYYTQGSNNDVYQIRLQ